MKTRQPAGRGKLTPMTVSMGFREFVLDQLGGLPELRPKAMFGGVGLYSGDVFFGIVAADSLYFKVDDTSRPAYERAGSTPFAPYVDGPQMRMATYYAVPAGVIENPHELLEWAKTSIAIAKTARRGKKEQKERTYLRRKG
jgi:DNA transformation protein